MALRGARWQRSCAASRAPRRDDGGRGGDCAGDGVRARAAGVKNDQQPETLLQHPYGKAVLERGLEFAGERVLVGRTDGSRTKVLLSAYTLADGLMWIHPVHHSKIVSYLVLRTHEFSTYCGLYTAL